MFRLVSVAAIVLIALLGCSAPAAAPDIAPSTPTKTIAPDIPTATRTVSGKPITIWAPDRPAIVVKAHNQGYAEIYQLVGGHGSHDVSQRRWQTIMDILGWEYPERYRLN